MPQIKRNELRRLISALNQVSTSSQQTDDDRISPLVEQGLSVHAKNNFGSSLLHIAANNGYYNAVNLLLAKGAKINEVDGYSRTALYVAAKNGYSDLTSLLLDNNANTTVTTKKNKFSVLHIAAKNGHLEIVKKLLQKDPGLLKLSDSKQRTALDVAISYGQLDVFKELISHQDLKAEDIVQALKIAIRHNQIEVIKNILSSHSINLNDDIINIAKNSNDEQVRKIFLDIQSVYDSAKTGEQSELLNNIEFPKVSYNNSTVFQTAIANKQYGIVEKIINNKSNTIEETFINAVQNKDQELIKFVLSKKPNIEDLYMLAMFDNNDEAIKILLKENKDTNSYKTVLSNIFNLCKQDSTNYLPKFEVLWRNVADPELAYKFLQDLSAKDTDKYIKLAKIILNDKHGIKSIDLLNRAFSEKQDNLIEIILKSKDDKLKQDLLTNIIANPNEYSVPMIDMLLHNGAKLNKDILIQALNSREEGIVKVVLNNIKEQKISGILLNQAVETNNTILVDTILNFEPQLLEQTVNLLNNNINNQVIDVILNKITNIDNFIPNLIANNNVEIIKKLLQRDNIADINKILSFAIKTDNIDLLNSSLNNKNINLTAEAISVLLVEIVNKQNTNIEIFRAIFNKFNEVNPNQAIKDLIINKIIDIELKKSKSSEYILKEVISNLDLYDFIANNKLITARSNSKEVTKFVQAQPYKVIQNLLVKAIQNNNNSLIKLIINNRPDIINLPLKNKLTLLQVAVLHGDPSIVELFLMEKANINAQSTQGITALYAAIQKSDPVLVDILLKNGANFEDRLPILQLAITLLAKEPENKDKVVTIIDLLLNHNKISKIINLQESNLGMSALHIAAKIGNKKLVDQLLQKNATINAKTKSGDTPLDLAVKNNHVEVVKELLANKKLSDEGKIKALAIAKSNVHENKDLIIKLIEKSILNMPKKMLTKEPDYFSKSLSFVDKQLYKNKFFNNNKRSKLYIKKK